MNLHVPLTLESVIELRFLTSVPTQIVSPQASKPVMGLVQDSLLGTYLFSQQQKLTLPEMMRLTCSVSSFSEPLPPLIPDVNKGTDIIEHPWWTSQQMMSQFLPGITYKKSGKYPMTKVVTPSGESKPKEGEISIVGGKMTAGVLDSATIGKKNNSLFHITWNDFGPIASRDLFNNLGFIANTWLQIQGFSCGISDCIIPQEDMAVIRDYVKQAKVKVSNGIQRAKLGEMHKGKDVFTYKRDFPKKVIKIMNKCRGNVETQTKKSIKSDNNIDIMVRCGSKGTANNLSQIVGMIGQQEIEASWIEDQLYRRTLPHYHKDDLRPEAHGFIENSFMSGLNPAEYWFHAQEGRIGIITKAIKTAETGYIQRKLIKILEDLRVCYDGTIRNANNMIIQTVYGNDGFDASYIETQKMFFLDYNMEQLSYKFKHLENENLRGALSPQAYAEFSESSDHGLLEEEFNQIVEYYRYLKENVPINYVQPDTRSPVNFERILLNIQGKFGLDKETVADINPLYIVEQVKNLRDKLVIDPSKSVNYVSTIILNSLMAINLSSKVLIYKYKFTKVAFDHLIKTIYLTFLKAIVNPGDNVGIIAAQSIGEPTTQMALNTFHYTGQGSKANISRGTPRLRELMSLTRNPKTPSMTIHLHDDYFIQDVANETNQRINHDRTEKIGAEIAYTTMRDLLIRTEIFYDNDDLASCIVEDQEFIDSYYDLLPSIENAKTIGEVIKYRWLLRFEFEQEAIMRKHIPMYLIQLRLSEYFKERNISTSVIVSDDNAHKLICRVKIGDLTQMPQSVSKDPINYLRDVESKLLDVPIKGIDGIDQCFVNVIKKDIVLPTGATVSRYSEEYDEAVKHHNNLKYLIETYGSNLIDVLCLRNIDMYRTVSNDVWEIYQIYGIEAARKCIITEIDQLLQYNETYIQERHLSLLVDVMTNQGTLVSVDRHGVNKTESGPLHRASFEETTTQLTNASIFNEVDQMTGVSGNIMFGQFIPTGTNAFRLALDIEKVKNQQIPKQTIKGPRTQKQSVEVVDLDDFCSDENFEFKFALNV